MRFWCFHSHFTLAKSKKYSILIQLLFLFDFSSYYFHTLISNVISSSPSYATRTGLANIGYTLIAYFYCRFLLTGYSCLSDVTHWGMLRRATYCASLIIINKYRYLIEYIQPMFQSQFVFLHRMNVNNIAIKLNLNVILCCCFGCGLVCVCMCSPCKQPLINEASNDKVCTKKFHHYNNITSICRVNHTFHQYTILKYFTIL